MADVDVSFYKPLQAPQQQNPLQLLQLLAGAQEYQARQAIGNAYRDNTGPDGEINVPGLRSQIGQTGGFLSGQGLQQATANSAADLGLKTSYMQALHQRVGALAGKPNITDEDIAQAKVDAGAQGVPGGVVQHYFETLPSVKDQAKLRKSLVTRSNLARTPEAISAPVTVPGQRGEPIQIPESTAAYARAGGGLQTGMQPGFNTATEFSGGTGGGICQLAECGK